MTRDDRSAPRSFIRLRTQFDNIGDALINRELVRLVAAGSEVFIDVADCPKAFEADVVGAPPPRGVRSLRRAGNARLLAIMVLSALRGRRCFYFLLPGGMTGEKSVVGAWKARLYAALLGAVKAAGVTVCHLGMSYSGLGPRYRQVLAARSRVVDVHYVRDEETRAYAEASGIRVDGIVPDLSFGLYRVRPPQPSAGRDLAFSFRFDGRREGLRERVSRLVERAIETHGSAIGYRIVSQVGRDDEPLRQLYEELGDRHAGIDITFVRAATIDAGARAYAGVSVLFSNRLHALLIAAYAGARPVAVVDPIRDGKVSSLFRQIGLARNVVSADVDPASLDEVALPDPAACRQEYEALQRVFREVFDGRRSLQHAEPDGLEVKG